MVEKAHLEARPRPPRKGNFYRRLVDYWWEIY